METRARTTDRDLESVWSMVRWWAGLCVKGELGVRCFVCDGWVLAGEVLCGLVLCRVRRRPRVRVQNIPPIALCRSRFVVRFSTQHTTHHHTAHP